MENDNKKKTKSKSDFPNVKGLRQLIQDEVISEQKFAEIFKKAIKHDDMKIVLDDYIDNKLKNSWSAVLLKSLGNIKNATYTIIVAIIGGLITHFFISPKTPTQANQSKTNAAVQSTQ